MAERLREHDPRSPSERLRDKPHDGYFYPREVAAILDIPDIDYHQLRRLYRLVRQQCGLPTIEGWARYTLTDIAAIKEAIRLSGGESSLRPGRRLQIKCVEDACLALHRLGIANPLLDVKLHREPNSRRVLAEIDGTLLDPLTGQTALAVILPDAERIGSNGGPALLRRLRQESHHKPRRTKRATRNTGVLVVRDDVRAADSATG